MTSSHTISTLTNSKNSKTKQIIPSLSKNEAKRLIQKARQDILVVGDTDDSLDINDKYPVAPHPIMVKSGKGKPSSLDNRVSILTWDKNLSSQVDKVDALELSALQKELRLKFYFTASSANPWDKSTFTKWRHVVEASVLQAMQTAYKGTWIRSSTF